MNQCVLNELTDDILNNNQKKLNNTCKNETKKKKITGSPSKRRRNKTGKVNWKQNNLEVKVRYNN